MNAEPSSHAKADRGVRRAIACSDLPAAFTRGFQPVIAHSRERGLPRYLFDRYGLEFYRAMVTAEPVPPESIWSVLRDASQECESSLVAGLDPDAAGFVVTQVPRHEQDPRTWTLPKRLTLRQRVRCATIQSMLEDLVHAPFHVPGEVLELIETRLRDTRRGAA